MRAFSSVTSVQITQFFNGIFALFGHPTFLTSDNGPQFISHSFKSYLRKRGIIHRRSAVYNPQSNGVCERVNKNIKKLLNSVEITNIFGLQEELDRYAMNYNATHHSTTGKPPSDLMLLFKMRTRLNVVMDENEELFDADVSDRIASRSQKAADYANARRRPTFENKYRVGDSIVTKQGRVRRIVSQVGKYSFKLDDGFCVNVRNIRSKTSMPDPTDMFNVFPPTTPIVTDTVEDVVPYPAISEEDVVEHPAVHSPPRRSTRPKRFPSHLKDYVVKT